MMELNRLDAPELHRRTLWHLFQEGQATRQSLKDALGCTLLTASKAVTALLESGLLVVDGTVSSAMGRRKSVLKLNPRHRLCLCADIGYGSLKVALVRFNGEIEKKIIIPGLPDPIQSGIPYEELLRVMEALILEAGCERILGVGVGISGMVHFESGRVLFCPNIQGFEDRPLAGELEERFGLPVLLDTSARCMTMGASVLVGAVNLFTPSLVVLGGGFPHFFPQIVDELQQRVLSACLPPMHTRLRLTGAALGEDASLRGAAGMLIQNYLMHN